MSQPPGRRISCREGQSRRSNPMSMKTKAAILVSSAAILLFMVVGSLDGVRASSNDGAYRQLQVYSEVLSRVRSEYVEEPNIPQVTDGALHGLLESLDANSSYLSPAEYKEYKSHRTEAKGEIGAAISKRFGYAAVVSVIPGGPADKAGLQASDIIEAIEGKSTREMSLAEVPNLFLNHGTITYLQGQKYPREAFNADPSKAITTLPLVVLVNKGTAGAAEVVAAAVLENARGDVVGDKTFGDGSVQKTIELPDGSALMLSIAKYYSPSGKAIQDSAVTPNILAADGDDDGPLPDEDQTTAPPEENNKKQPPQQDEQLHKAIQVLKSRTS